MIFDKIANISSYSGLSTNFGTAISFLKSCDLTALPVGRISIDGERVYGIVSEKQLSEIPLLWEVHRRYADIHCILDGHERIDYCSTDSLAQPVQFPVDGDSCLIESLSGFDFEMGAGDFMILLPQDVHRPNCLSRFGNRSRKIVIKVLLD